MAKNYIINFVYKKYPLYQKLREHPEWQSILVESDKRAAEQRKIYLKFVSENAKPSL